MLFGVYFLLLVGTSIAAPNSLKFSISTTDVSAIRLGHAAANTGPPVGPAVQPTRMRHLCKNMQNTVQNTATRLFMIIRFSRPSLSNEVDNIHKDDPPKGPFLHRVHRALMSLGLWEGRIVAFVLGCGIGVLLRMVWVLAILLGRGVRGTPEREETIFLCAEEIVPPYTGIDTGIDEKKAINNGEN